MTDLNPKDPKFLAFWTKCLRESMHWSQEALAEASGLDVRTIQRIEAGRHQISITTRRMLATGLGYDNPDIFDDPSFQKSINELAEGIRKIHDEEIQKQFPDHIRIKAKRVCNGHALARVAYEAGAYLFHAGDGVSQEAQETAASIFDFVRDLGDIADECSFAERRSYESSLSDMLKELEDEGAACYSAFRATKVIGAFWEDETPLPLTIGYLTIVPKEQVFAEIMAPRRLS